MSDVQVNSISIKISVDADGAIKKLKSVTNNVKDMSNTMKASGLSDVIISFKKMGAAAREAENAVAKLTSKFSKTKMDFSKIKGAGLKQIFSNSGGSFRGWDAEKFMNMGEFERLDRKIGILMTKMEEAASKGDDLAAIRMTEQVNKLQAQLDALQKSSSGGLVENLKAIGQALARYVKPAAQSFLDILKKAASVVTNIAKSVIRLGGNLIKSLGRGILNGAKGLTSFLYNQSPLKSLSGTLKGLHKSLSKVGTVTLFHAVRTGIKYITDSFKEGAERAYFFAKEYGSATKYIADALDGLSSGGFKMQNQLGAAWSTLIATVQPVLTEIINLTTRATQAVTQFFAVMSGSDTYLKAKDYTHAWADDTEKAAKAAKEWKNQLMGFDEINRLEEPSDSSGGNSDLYKDYENMFEEVAVESKFADFFRQIRTMIKSGEWTKLGIMFGEKLNSLTDRFNWAGWGAKIGKGIQNGIDLAYNFLKTYNFKNLGSRLMEMLDSLGDEISFNRLGRLATRVKTTLWDVLYGAFTRPGSMGRLAQNISDFVIGALNELSDWIDSLEPSKIATALSDFFGKIKYEEIKDSFVTVIQKAWQLAIDTKDLFLQSETGQKLTQKLVDLFGDENGQITWASVGNKIREKLSEAWTNATAILDQIWPKDERDKFKQQILDQLEAIGKAAGAALWSGFKKGFGSLTESSGNPQDWLLYDYFYKDGENAVDGFWAGFKKRADESWNDSFLGQFVNKVIEKFRGKDGFDCHSPSKVMESIGSDVATGFKNGISNALEEVRSTIKGKLDEIKQLFNVTWSFPKIKMPHFSWTWQSIGKYVQIPRISVSWYKNGGVLEDGLFTMNHGEIAGKFSNGQSVVANNQMITDGIAEAAYSAFMRAISDSGVLNGNTENGQRGDIVLKINDREFARATYPAYKAVAREKGISMISNFA